MVHANPLPWWSRPASRFNTWLLRLGLRIGTQHILSVPGRKTGRMRSTPVSLVTLDGQRYVVSGEGLDWVANARAAGSGDLFRAGRRERIRLTELPVDARRPVLRAFWHQVPHGRPFIARFFGLAPDAGPGDFEAAASRCPVFRLEPATGSESEQSHQEIDSMPISITRTFLAGVAGGLAFWMVTALTFVLVGSGLDQASGPLVDPRIQSPKLLAVWTELEPLPLFATAPHLILLGYTLFGVAYAFLLRSVQAAWPGGRWPRVWRLAVVIWALSCLFFEFLGPLNLLGEPVPLVALELAFWSAAAIVEASILVGLLSVSPASSR
jgi:hypothetical protein